MSYEIIVGDIPKNKFISFIKSKGFKKVPEGQSAFRNTYLKGDIAVHPQGDKYKKVGSLALYGKMFNKKNTKEINKLADEISNKFKARLEEYY